MRISAGFEDFFDCFLKDGFLNLKISKFKIHKYLE